MTNEEILTGLLELAQKQQENINALNTHIASQQKNIATMNLHIIELEDIVKAQQKTIDKLADLAQPINIAIGSTALAGNGHQNQIAGNHYKNAETISEGDHTQNFNTGSNA